MSSYTLSGDDILFGANIFQKAGKILKKAAVHSPIGQAVKFVAHPIKQTKAAITTIARFDPTAKTAKYSNVTKGVLAGAALAGATILTGGGAAVVAGGLASAAGTGFGIARKPVRKPPKTIAPDIIPGVASPGTVPSAQYMDNPVDSFNASIPPPIYEEPGQVMTAGVTAGATGDSSGKSPLLMVVGIAAVAGLVIYYSKKKVSAAV